MFKFSNFKIVYEFGSGEDCGDRGLRAAIALLAVSCFWVLVRGDLPYTISVFLAGNCNQSSIVAKFKVLFGY